MSFQLSRFFIERFIVIMHLGRRGFGIHNTRKGSDINSGWRLETSRTRIWNAKPGASLTYLVVILLASTRLVRASKEDRISVAVPSDARTGYVVAELSMATESTQYRLTADNTPYVLSGNASMGWRVSIRRPINSEDMIRPSQTLVVFSLPAPPRHLIFVNATIFKADTATSRPTFKDGPSFSRSSMEVTFVENTTSNKVQLEWAKDRNEAPDNSAMKYDFVSGNEAKRFSLSAETSNPRGPMLYLSNRLPLDREEKSSYALNISAQDDFLPPAFAYLSVKVFVEDVNDNAPIFDKALYEVNVSQSTPVGFPIVEVSARDLDSGSNGRVVYRLVDNYSGQFAIDPNAGLITAAKSPLVCSDPCSLIGGGAAAPFSKCDNKCVFPVEAADGGSPRPLTSRCYVSVTLMDDNVHAPVITFSNVDSRNTLVIGADMSSNTVVSLVVVKDSDHGPNGLIDLTIVSGNEAGTFALERTSVPFMFLLKLSKAIDDLAKIARFVLSFRANDYGTPQRSSYADLTVIVNRTTVAVLAFENSSVTARIPDDSPLGSFVAFLHVASSTRPGATVAYDIVSGNNLSWFSVDQTTGLVVTSAILDAEVQSRALLLLSASSSGSRSYANLSVEIDKVRPSCPFFDFETFYVTKKISGHQSRDIITLSSGEGSDYEYDPEVEVRYPGLFFIGRRSGVVSFSRELGRSDVGVYSLRVASYLPNDRFCPATNTTVLLNVSIEDSAGRPSCYPLNYFIQLAGFETYNDIVARIVCNKTDSYYKRRRMSYSVSSMSSGNFALDSLTGSIRLTSAVSASNLNSLMLLNVQALDQSTGLSSLDEIKVFISSPGALKSSLNFSQGRYFFSIEEDNGLSPQSPASFTRTIGQVVLSGVIEQSVTYIIAEGDDESSFSVDAKTGWLRQVKPLDREKRSHYNLTVVAYNALRFAKVQAEVVVADVNDNAPVFWDVDNFVEISSGMPVGCQLVALRAVDLDAGRNASLTYNMSSDLFGLLRLDRASGTITTTKPLSFSFALNSTTYTIYVEVADQGSPSLKSSMSITFVVKSFRVLPQSFVPKNYNLASLTLFVSESTPVSSKFYCLTTPPDYVSYRFAVLHETGDDSIKIFPDGCLYVASPLDRETTEMYKLLIGVDTRESCDTYFRVYPKMTVLISVLDDNDNAPQFDDVSYEFEIEENLDQGSEVAVMTAYDLDIGDNADIVYGISNNSNFRVDPVTGLVTTSRKLDREEIVASTGSDVLVFRVVAVDRGRIPLSSEVTVSVTVIDVNDNQPIFERDVYSVSLSLRAEPNQVIARVKAQDKDDHDNGRVTYAILKSEPAQSAYMFEVDQTSGEVKLLSLLTLVPSEFFRLTILANDHGTSTFLYSTTTVEITVEPDEPAVQLAWKKFAGLLFVSRYQPAGSLLARVKCISINGATTLNYSIDPSSLPPPPPLSLSTPLPLPPPPPNSYFNIDAITGRLFLVKSLLGVSFSSLNLSIRATDLAMKGRSINKTMMVTLTDAIPFSPSFKNLKTELFQNVPSNTKIYGFKATEGIQDANLEFNYSIVSSSLSNVIIINNSSGSLLTNDSMSISNNSLVTVERCHVGKLLPNHRLCSQMNLEIVAIKSLKTIPRFLTGEALVVYPGTKAGAFVGRARAIIQGNPFKPPLVYSIDFDSCRCFSIDPRSGIVYLKRALPAPPAPTLSRCNLTVSVTVGSIESSRSTKNYTVVAATGFDLVFSQAESSSKVYENQPPARLMTLAASSTRPQQADDFTLDFHILSVNFSSPRYDFEGQSAFLIDRKSGSISSRRSLDREVDGPFVAIEVLAVGRNSGGTSTQVATATVSIEILDRNDNSPIFIGYQNQLSVPSDALVQSPLTTYSALDPDSSDVVTYSLKSEPQDGRFAIDPNKGIVRIRQALRSNSGYLLTVTASDGLRSSNVTTAVRVVEAAAAATDFAPKFTRDTFVFEVREDAVPGTWVGQVQAVDENQPSLAWYSLDRQVVYSVTAAGRNYGFEIDSISGVIRVAPGAPLDREKVHYRSFAVVASKPGSYPPSEGEMAHVLVRIVGVNDNHPLFTMETYRIEVEEETNVPLELLKVKAVDPDLGDRNHNKIVYKLQTKSDRWRFDLDSGSGQLFLLKPLDRERDSTASVKVLAIDGRSDDEDCKEGEEEEEEGCNDDGHGDGDGDGNGGIRLTSTATVLITIKNINDNPPKFIQPTPDQVSIAEDARPGTVVFEVKAVDLESSPLSYELGGHDDTFSIDRRSGRVTLIDRLDRENIDSYALEITAVESNGGNSSDDLRTTVVVVVDVVDVNDNRPTFDRRFYSSSVDFSSLRTCTSLATARATDPDDGLNGAVRYSIVGGNASTNFFYVDPQSGSVEFNSRPGLTVDATFDLTIEATDLGSPPLTSRAALKVEVVGVGGHELPVFSRNEYRFGVVEGLNASAAKPLPLDRLSLINEWSLTAAPGSGLEFGMLESEDEEALPFSVEKSGMIGCVRSLDREQKEVYAFKVYARTGSGVSQRSATSRIVVEVHDANDNNPEFEFNEYKSSVTEDAPLGTRVAQLVATDRDLGRNGRLWYSIHSVSTWSPYSPSSSSSSTPPSSSSSSSPMNDTPFKIDPESGLVTLTAGLDREAIPGYRVVVKATDRGFEPRSGTSQLYVTVLDVNDNSPVYQREIYDVRLKDPTPTGSFVYGVTAVDADLGSNGSVTYSMVTGQADDFFWIDPDTGVITSKKSLSSSSSSSPSQFEFFVTASDKGNPQLASRAKVSVSFYSNSASGFPVFSSGFPRSITANGNIATAGSILAVVSATTLKPTPPSYFISAGNVADRFAINWKDGRLILKRDLIDSNINNEDVSSTIWIEARDVDGLSSFLPLSINVTGSRRSKPPTFSTGGYHFSVPEDAGVGTAVASVVAVAGDAASFQYDVATTNRGDDDSAFAVGKTTGVISVAKRMNRTLVARCRFWVVARDSVGASSSVEVVIDIVSSSSDGRPIFSEIFSGSVLENSPIGTYVFTVTTSDGNALVDRRNTRGTCKPDPGLADGEPRTRYYFVEDSPLFRIDETTGVVTVAGNLDYEAKSEYLLKVSARRGGFNVETLASVDVIDDNDHVPTCPDLKFQVEIPRLANRTSALVVGNLSSAAVAGLRAGCYRCRRPSPFLKVENSVLLLRPWNAGSTLVHRWKFFLEAVTADLMAPQLTAQCAVAMETFQENLYTPVFSKDAYSLAVPREAEAGYLLMVVTARDGDTWKRNSAITYSIVEDVGALFVTLNSSTGQLALRRKLTANVTLTISASDAGLKRKSSTSKLLLFPVDSSAFDPSFDSDVIDRSVDDSLPVGTSVSRLTASDGGKRAVCFSFDLEPDFSDRIVPDGSALPPSFPRYFQVNGSTGEISIVSPLGAVHPPLGTSAFKYRAWVARCEAPFKRARAYVVFEVYWRSLLRFGCGHEPSWGSSVAVDALPGTVVASTAASRGFVESRQTVAVDLISGTEAFEATPYGYDIALGRLPPPTWAVGATFNATTRMRSLASPYEITCSTPITVVNGDCRSVSFETIRYVFVANATNDANVVGKVRVASPACPWNDSTYSIVPGSDRGGGGGGGVDGSSRPMFRVDPRSGEIFLADPGLFSSVGVVDLLISVIYVDSRGSSSSSSSSSSPSSGRTLADTCRVKIKMRDFQTRLAFVPSNLYSTTVEDSTEVGATVVRVVAKKSPADDDEPGDQQGTVVYSLADNAGSAPFEVDPVGGWIRVSRDLTMVTSLPPLDPVLVYNFTVVAKYKDGSGRESLSSTATVVVVVTSRYSNKSQFECLHDRPCQNNGTCQREAAGSAQVTYGCRCPTNVRGSDCSVLGPAFKALESQLLYENLPARVMASSLSLAVELSTLRSDSLLVYYTAGSSTYLALELIAGRPRLRVAGSSGGKVLEKTVDVPMDLADGSWWGIRVEATANSVIMSVSYCPNGSPSCNSCQEKNSSCSSTSFVGSNLMFESTNQKLYVGGVDDVNILLTNPRRASTHTYEGCLRLLTLGDLDVFQRATPTNMAAVRTCNSWTSPAFAVPRKSQCASNPCSDTGTCQDTIDLVGYKCRCRAGHDGRNCLNETQAVELGAGAALEFIQSEEFRRSSLLNSPPARLTGGNRKRKRSSSEPSFVRVISMIIRTKEKQGLLMATKTRDEGHKHLLYILRGHLTYDVMNQNSSSSTSLSVSNNLVLISDDAWHQVVLKVFDTKVQLTVDEKAAEQPSSSSSFGAETIDPLNLDIASFTLGSLEVVSVRGENLPGFRGCLSNFSIDGEIQPTSGSNDRFDVTYDGNDGDSFPPACPLVVSPSPSTPASSNPDSWKTPAIASAALLGSLLTLALLVIVVVVVVRRREREKRTKKDEGGIEMNSVNHDDSGGRNYVDANARVAVTSLNSNRPDIVVTGRRRRRRSSWSDDDSVKEVTAPATSRNPTPLTTLSEKVEAKNVGRLQSKTPTEPPDPQAPRKSKFSIMAALPRTAVSFEARPIDRRILDDEASTIAPPERAISPSDSSVHRLGLDKPGFRIAQGTKVGPVWTTPVLEKPLLGSGQIGPAPRSRSTEPRSQAVSPGFGLTLEEIHLHSRRPTSVDLFAKRAPQSLANTNPFREAGADFVGRSRHLATGRRNHPRRIDDSDDSDDFDDKTDAFTCSEFDLGTRTSLAFDRLELNPPPPRPHSSIRMTSASGERNSQRRIRSLRADQNSETPPRQKSTQGDRRSSTTELCTRPRRQLPTPTASGLIGPELLDWNFESAWNSWLPLVSPVFVEFSRLPCSSSSSSSVSVSADHVGSATSLKNHMSSSSCLSVELDSRRPNFSRARLTARPDASQESVFHVGASQRDSPLNRLVDNSSRSKGQGARKGGMISCRLNDIKEERV